MTTKPRTYQRMLVLNEPHGLRINGALAQEIGFNESILLLQIEFLISISRHERDGRLWTYQSTRELQREYFPWWSVATINRTVTSLEEMGLITVGDYNAHKYDRTRWFSLNADRINTLKSVRMAHLEESPTENAPTSEGSDTRSAQNETRSTQNDTTIPETTPETTSEKKSSASADALPTYRPGPWIMTLASVCGMDAKLAGRRLAKRGKELWAAGYSVEQIEQWYGEGGWWYREDWRGKKGSFPTPEDIQATVVQARSASKPPRAKRKVTITDPFTGERREVET